MGFQPLGARPCPAHTGTTPSVPSSGHHIRRRHGREEGLDSEDWPACLPLEPGQTGSHGLCPSTYVAGPLIQPQSSRDSPLWLRTVFPPTAP